MASKKEIICKLTGTYGKGVKAHIVPKSFYMIEPQKDGVSKIMSNSPGVKPKKSPQGIYDTEIVTAEGEEYFKVYDDYAYRVLFEPGILIEKNIEGCKYWVAEFDYEKLKIFILSVLWRASVSNQVTNKSIALGIHENRIRNIILTGQLENDWQYPVVISRWYSDKHLPYVMADHDYTKFDGYRCIRLYCGEYLFYVFVESRPVKAEISKLAIKPGQSSVVLGRDIDNSKELEVMKLVVRANS